MLRAKRKRPGSWSRSPRACGLRKLRTEPFSGSAVMLREEHPKCRLPWEAAIRIISQTQSDVNSKVIRFYSLHAKGAQCLLFSLFCQANKSAVCKRPRRGRNRARRSQGWPGDPMAVRDTGAVYWANAESAIKINPVFRSDDWRLRASSESHHCRITRNSSRSLPGATL